MRTSLVILLVTIASPAAAEPADRIVFGGTALTLTGDDLALSAGGGVRVDVGRHAIEVAGPALGVTPDGDAYAHRYLGVAWSVRPSERVPSLALGAGLAYGSRIVVETLDAGVAYQHHGKGLYAGIHARYALHDAPAVFTQLDVHAPFHTIDTWGERTWSPGATLAIGVGF